jgi:glutathione synthase/RimK-type ligase-like ATP-grasp enzyme
VGGEVIFTQRKARKTSVEEPNWAVRNLAGGFVYVAAEAGEGPPDELAIKAVAALGLDFGAVDVILGRDGQFYVLEVNTACGLEERTADKYVEAFKEMLNESH